MSNVYFTLDEARDKLGLRVRLLTAPEILPSLPVGSVGFVEGVRPCGDGRYKLGVTFGCVKYLFDRVEWEMLEEVER